MDTILSPRGRSGVLRRPWESASLGVGMMGSVHSRAVLVLPDGLTLTSPLVGIRLASYHRGCTPILLGTARLWCHTQNCQGHVCATGLTRSNGAKFRRGDRVLAISLGYFYSFLFRHGKVEKCKHPSLIPLMLGSRRNE